MRCKICGDLFYTRRGINDLFRTKEETICRKCIIKHGINIEIENIILDLYEIRIVSLFKRKEKIEYNLFTDDFSKIYKALLLNDGYKVLFFDHIIINDETIEEFDGFTKLFESNLIIMCLSKRNDY